MKPFEINVLETFPHLTKTPIAEAALEIRARADDSWTEETVSATLRAQLPDYPSQKPGREFAASLSVQAGFDVKSTSEILGSFGIKAKNKDGKHIAFWAIKRQIKGPPPLEM